MTGATQARDHGALMDSVYRGQRHIYDATRKYFLFGRDRLIDELDCKPGMTLLEIGCGTGRNLAKIRRKWRGIEICGLDISSEMLKNARAALGPGARLARGDATQFSPDSLFGRAGFDRVVLSYALSMIPDWQAAIRQALGALAPGGSLHIVDFGDGSGFPGPFRSGLIAWLRHFHVQPRISLGIFALRMAEQLGWNCEQFNGPGGYFTSVKVTRPPI